MYVITNQKLKVVYITVVYNTLDEALEEDSVNVAKCIIEHHGRV